MSFVSIVLFLVGSTWFIELGGLEREHLRHLNHSEEFKRTQFTTSEFLGHHVVRLKVDIPSSEHAPPIAAVAPVLDALSMMGFTLLSHNDESRPNKNMLYSTWMLQKEHMSISANASAEEE